MSKKDCQQLGMSEASKVFLSDSQWPMYFDRIAVPSLPEHLRNLGRISLYTAAVVGTYHGEMKFATNQSEAGVRSQLHLQSFEKADDAPHFKQT